MLPYKILLESKCHLSVILHTEFIGFTSGV